MYGTRADFGRNAGVSPTTKLLEALAGSLMGFEARLSFDRLGLHLWYLSASKKQMCIRLHISRRGT